MIIKFKNESRNWNNHNNRVKSGCWSKSVSNTNLQFTNFRISFYKVLSMVWRRGRSRTNNFNEPLDFGIELYHFGIEL